MYWGLALRMRCEGGGGGKKSRKEKVNPVIRDVVGWWDIMIKCYLHRMRISLKQSLFHLGKLHQRGRESVQEQQYLMLLEGRRAIFDIFPFQLDLFTAQLVLFFIIKKLHPIASCDNNMTVAGCINIASEILSLELWSKWKCVKGCSHSRQSELWNRYSSYHCVQGLSEVKPVVPSANRSLQGS